MAVVRVTHGIGDLTSDLGAGAQRVPTRGPAIVQRNVERGNSIARRYAKAASGPHGLNYFKRITAEMTGPLEGEYGPHGDVVENAVGAGWRGGPQNTDLPRSADVIGPKFADEAGELLDGLL